MSFQEIKGQDRPIQILKEALAQGRLMNSYLFSGPEGVGKKLTARTLAAAVNCLERDDDACGRCASCRKIEAGRHPDVHIIDKATLLTIVPERQSSASSEIRIDHIRQLKKEINLRPYEARKKVFIIDDAHNLNAEASNALLKTLEEPPQDSIIILASDKPRLLFKTIISRCSILKFSCLERPVLEEILKKDYSLAAQEAHFLAYLAEGRLGCALRLKDTDIIREKNRVLDKIALSTRPALETLATEDREQVRSHLNWLATWFRDIYLLKNGLPYLEVINLDRREELLKEAGRFSLSDVSAILDAISDAILYLEQHVNVKLLLHNLGAQLWTG